MIRRLILVLLLAIAAGCSGGIDSNLEPIASPHSVVPGAGVVRDASGAPVGVRVSWGTVQGVSGYRLYRSAQPIPDTSRGDNSLWVSPEIIPQPGALDQFVSFDDLFPVQIGEQWHYRVTAVDSIGTESALSPENQLTIGSFSIIRLINPSVPVDGVLEIEGENFGLYAPDDGDEVRIPGVEWLSGVGFSPVEIVASVLEWEPDLIHVQVPLGATIGRITVVVGGEEQQSPEDFVNADPYLTSVTPITASVLELVTVEGGNFGATFDDDHRLVVDGVALDPTRYLSYSDSQIEFNPPYIGGFLGTDTPLWVLVDQTRSNTGYLLLTNAPPVADITAEPTDGEAPLLVDFDASASTDPEGTRRTFQWDFDGDGSIDASTGTVATAQFEYQIDGVYLARVVVTDLHGATDEATVRISVNLPLQNEPPVAILDAEPQEGDEPLTVFFDATASFDPEGGELNFQWDFDGDGKVDSNTGDVGTTQFEYLEAGVYQARVIVTDIEGASDEDTVEITVNQGPR